MSDFYQQIEGVKKEIRETPYHKGTEHYIGMLKARLSRLKDKVLEMEFKDRGGSGGGYAVKKHGDATVVLVGPPSVGKSTLINKLTNVHSKTAEYAFTTVNVIPGMMILNNAFIQIFDVPGLLEGAEEGRGKGKEVLSVIRGSDLILNIAEPGKIHSFEAISNTLERNGIRINQARPNVVIDKKLEGGIIIKTNIKQEFSKETAKEIATEMGIKNAVISINEKITVEEFIDSLSKNKVYIPAIFILNKTDLLTSQNQIKLTQNVLKISAEKSIGLEDLKKEIWNKLDLINVYLVKKDEDPSYLNPLIVKRGISLRRVAEKIGEEFAQKVNHAQIWGSDAIFPGQEVSLSTKTQDKMQIRFV